MLTTTKAVKHMKKVVVVTIRNEIGKMYHEELSSIFYDCLEIMSYRIETDHKYNTNSDYIKSADVILLTNLTIFSFIKNMVNEKHKILFLDCGFLKNKIESLKNYPRNTRALVCFNYYAVSTKAITTIHEMGVTNLVLTAYNPDAPVPDEKYDLAIVGESSAIVPNNIETIISLGRRKVNFKTLMDLAVATDTLSDIIGNRIMNYSLEIASSSQFFDNTLSYETSTKNQLNTVMDFIDYSIMILNNNYEILNYNKNLLQMFNLKDSLLNKNISEIPEISKLAEHIDNENTVNKLIVLNDNKRILITVRVLKDSLLKSESNSYLILMRDVTDVMKLEGTLKKQMEKRGYTTKYNFLNIYGKGREIQDCVEKAKIFGKLDKSVLIVGESGTGKELFAHSMHDYSPRKNYPFIGINCAALPSTLLESELFGYEEGTFTGAKRGGKRGLFELANNGTLFLDEIGDMTIETQTKLLRVLEEKEFMRLGSGEIISIDVRIMAATNKDLRELINEGLFRLDLYYRLNTYMLKIPPLRNRKGDIEYLIRMFIEEESKAPVSIDEDVINFLVNCNWYGNVRELKNCIEYMVTISKGSINMSHIPDYIMEEHWELNKNLIPRRDVLYELNGMEKDIALVIMREICNTSCGRRKIYEILRKTYPGLTEYKLRMIINILVEKNLIKQGTGRSGMSLTNAGLKYIEAD